MKNDDFDKMIQESINNFKLKLNKEGREHLDEYIETLKKIAEDRIEENI